MKEYMLFTREEMNGDFNIFRGDYDTVSELLDSAKSFSGEAYYKIISSRTEQALADGPIKNLIE